MTPMPMAFPLEAYTRVTVSVQQNVWVPPPLFGSKAFLESNCGTHGTLVTGAADDPLADMAEHMTQLAKLASPTQMARAAKKN